LPCDKEYFQYVLQPLKCHIYVYIFLSNQQSQKKTLHNGSGGVGGCSGSSGAGSTAAAIVVVIPVPIRDGQIIRIRILRKQFIRCALNLPVLVSCPEAFFDISGAGSN
jgi:hypothetical protein